MNWTINGAEREAFVYAPVKGKGPAPLVFAFHGHGGNMRFAARGMHFQNEWPEAIVVYMQGLPSPSLVFRNDKELRPGWQFRAGDQSDRDLKFFDAVLKTLHEKFSVDDNRIYATGFSNGGLFTYLLWAERPNIFAAYAPGGAVIIPGVQIDQPRAAFCFGGRRDRLTKFEKQEASVESLRKLNGCEAKGQECGQYCTVYPSAKGTAVQTYFHPGGHVYPPPVSGLIVQFFKDHPRKS